MAFKNCFYLQFLKDDNPSIDFSEEDFTWQSDELKPDMYYGYEKLDGTEPNWVKIGFNEGEARHIDVAIGQKIYFKGTRTIGVHWLSGSSLKSHHSYKWFGLENKTSNTIIKVGGCPISLLNDGDGTPTNPIVDPINGQSFGFGSMFNSYKGYLILSDLTFPSNTANTIGLLNYMFCCDATLLKVPKGLFLKHELGTFEFCAMFQNCTIMDPVWLPFDENDCGYRSFYAMFYYTKMNALHVDFHNWPDTERWVRGVQTTTGKSGLFYSPDDLPISYGETRVPSGWLINQTRPTRETIFALKYHTGDKPNY